MQSWDSENAQCNLEIAQTLRLHGTCIYTLYKTKLCNTYTKEWTQTQEDLFWSDTPVLNPYFYLIFYFLLCRQTGVYILCIYVIELIA